MKKFITLLAFTLLVTNFFGQSPASFNYQAVLRDASGAIKANTSATIRIDLLQGSTTGTSAYSESFSVTTNAFGLINLQIGKGTVISDNMIRSFHKCHYING